MGCASLHRTYAAEGTAQSHHNTQLSFPRKRESSIDAGYLDSRLRGNDDLFEMCRYPCPEGEGANNTHYLAVGSVSGNVVVQNLTPELPARMELGGVKSIGKKRMGYAR